MSGGVNGVPRVFRFFQQAPTVAEYLVPLAERRLSNIEVSAHRQLKPLSLATTQHPGVYWYRDEQGRTGWMRTEHFYEFEVDSLQQLILVEELSEAVGVPEPWMQDKPLFTGGQPRAGNPYFLIGAGIVFIALAAYGIATLVRVGENGQGLPIWLIALAALVGLIGVSVLLIIRGSKRLRWWRLARAEATRCGIELPDKLTGLGI